MPIMNNRVSKRVHRGPRTEFQAAKVVSTAAAAAAIMT
ncbi:hypothetical protein NSERUTF1_4864 [Nocardia seriolae]|nr:hypothetical protein NSERUTF1_4864 [Nocardia seriolae]